MLALLSSIFGFAAPFFPQLIQYFRDKADREHELAMFELRMKFADKEHGWKMEEINAHADIAEMQSLRSPQQSFGVQLLDAGQKWATTAWGKWLITPGFYLFAILDFVNGMVRPTVTYAIVWFYMLVKYGQYEIAKIIASTGAQAATSIWSEQDFAILTLVLSYFFGARVAKAVFGGSASTGKPGA